MVRGGPARGGGGGRQETTAGARTTQNNAGSRVRIPKFDWSNSSFLLSTISLQLLWSKPVITEQVNDLIAGGGGRQGLRRQVKSIMDKCTRKQKTHVTM